MRWSSAFRKNLDKAISETDRRFWVFWAVILPVEEIRIAVWMPRYEPRTILRSCFNRLPIHHITAKARDAQIEAQEERTTQRMARVVMTPPHQPSAAHALVQTKRTTFRTRRLRADAAGRFLGQHPAGIHLRNQRQHGQSIRRRYDYHQRERDLLPHEERRFR